MSSEPSRRTKNVSILTNDNRRLSLPDRPDSNSEPVIVGPRTDRFDLLKNATDAAEQFIKASIAPNTARSYASDIRHFQGWCYGRGLISMPALPSTVALYISDLMTTGKRTSTVRRRLASISQAHQLSGHDTPTSAREVKTVWKGIRRTYGVATTRKRAIRVAELRGLLAACGTGTIGRRDRAIILLGFTGAFRRCELVALDLSDLQFVSDGLIIRIRCSKTDQDGEGRGVGMPVGRHAETCPYLAVQAWIATAGISEGPLFRPVDRHGHVRNSRLSAQSVALVVKRAAKAAGLNSMVYAAHSLRSGFCTSAAEAGIAEHLIARQTGHRSIAILRGYIQAGHILNKENPVRSLDL